MSAVGFEYDPDNILQHTSFWIEEDIDKEWPKSLNSERKKYAQNELVPPGAVPDKFFFSVETVGCISPEEVVIAAVKVMQAKLGALVLHIRQLSS